MATFAQLKTRVKDYLIDVPTKTDALVGDWINRAITKAEERFNFQHMMASQEFTTVEDTRVLSSSLPTRWKSLRDMPFFTEDDSFQATQEIGHATSEGDMRRQYAELDDGSPDFLLFSEADDEIQVWPLPDGESDHDDGEYRITVPYWRKTAALANDGDTNWFTDNAEWYVTFFAAAEGFLFNRDEQAAVFFERANAELAQLVRTNKQTQKRLPRMLVPRRDVYAGARKPPREL